MKDILFSPYLEKHKAPLGALCINEECKLTLLINKEFNIYKCKLVKEKNVKYIGKIASPDDAFLAAIKLGFATYSDCRSQEAN